MTGLCRIQEAHWQPTSGCLFPIHCANSRLQGGWVMKAEDIVGLTPQEIKNKFALPNTPKYICDVNLEAGTRLRTGEVNPLFGFDGGGQQYDLIINGKNVGTCTNERIIGQ